jgi:hypothetical protein
MYNPENIIPVKAELKKSKKKKESIRFAVKVKEIRDERENKIDDTVKDLLAFLIKNKVDDRDAQIVLYKARRVIAARSDLSE